MPQTLVVMTCISRVGGTMVLPVSMLAKGSPGNMAAAIWSILELAYRSSYLPRKMRIRSASESSRWVP